MLRIIASEKVNHEQPVAVVEIIVERDKSAIFTVPECIYMKAVDKFCVIQLIMLPKVFRHFEWADFKCL